jgi:tetratricopeptide (TPR) repeat protein
MKNTDTHFPRFIQRVRLVIALCFGLMHVHTFALEQWEIPLGGRYVELKKQGRNREATSVLKDWLEKCEEFYGPSHPNTAIIVNELGMMYLINGETTRAEQAGLRALKIREQVLGEADPATIQSINNMAHLYQVSDEFPKAINMYKRVIRIQEQTFGPDHINDIDSYQDLAKVYRDMGDLDKAEELFTRSLKIAEAALGPQNSYIAVPLENLAGIHMRRLDYAKAEELYKRALAILEKTRGVNSSDAAIILGNLAILYSDKMSDPARAEPLFIRALAIKEKAHGSTSPSVAADLDQMASFYHRTGDYAKADPLFARAISIKEKAYGKNNPEVGLLLSHYAGSLWDQGDWQAAEQLFSRALKIFEDSYGPSHQLVVTCLNNLGGLYLTRGDYAKAEPYCLRTLEIMEKTGRKISAPYACLAAIRESRGEYAQAEALYLQSLEMKEHTFGADNSTLGSPLTALACNAHHQGKDDKATAYLKRANLLWRKSWKNLLSYTSEIQREAAQQTNHPLDGPATVGDALLVEEVSLWAKGSVLESILEDRRTARAADADPTLRALLAEAEAIKPCLFQATLEGKSSKISASQIQQLEARFEDLQKRIARQVSSMNTARKIFDSTVEQLQASLPQSSVFIDFIRYSHEHRHHDKRNDRYAVVVIAQGAAPSLVPLGEAAKLDRLIGAQRALSSEPPGDGETVAARDSALEKACRELYAAIITPIAKALPAGTKELILCPDGQIHFVAFASLLDEQSQFLSERYTLMHVSTGRDLLKEPKARQSDGTGSIVLLGDPDYTSTIPERLLAKASASQTSSKAQNLMAFNLKRGLSTEAQEIRFESLPGTQGLRMNIESIERFAKEGTAAGAKQSLAFDGYLGGF